MLKELFLILTNADSHTARKEQKDGAELVNIPAANRAGYSVYLSHSPFFILVISIGMILLFGWTGEPKIILGICLVVFAFVVPFYSRFDYLRIRNYIWRQGGQLLEIYWQPLGPGWIGGKGAIYRIVYLESSGLVKRASAKTSLFAGVYVTEVKTIGSKESGEYYFDGRTRKLKI